MVQKEVVSLFPVLMRINCASTVYKRPARPYKSGCLVQYLSLNRQEFLHLFISHCQPNIRLSKKKSQAAARDVGKDTIKVRKVLRKLIFKLRCICSSRINAGQTKTLLVLRHHIQSDCLLYTSDAA